MIFSTANWKIIKDLVIGPARTIIVKDSTNANCTVTKASDTTFIVAYFTDCRFPAIEAEIGAPL